LSAGSHDLAELTEAITEAFSHASQMLEEQHIALLERFFDVVKDDKGHSSFRAKMVTIRVPHADGEEHPDADTMGHIPVLVPLISLVPLNSLKLDELEVEFEAMIDEVVDHEHDKKPDHSAFSFLRRLKHRTPSGAPTSAAMPVDTPDPEPLREAHAESVATGSRIGVRMLGAGKRGKDGSNVKITIRVKGGDPPEGLVRVNDQILKQVP